MHEHESTRAQAYKRTSVVRDNSTHNGGFVTLLTPRYLATSLLSTSLPAAPVPLVLCALLRHSSPSLTLYSLPRVNLYGSCFASLQTAAPLARSPSPSPPSDHLTLTLPLTLCLLLLLSTSPHRLPPARSPPRGIPNCISLSLLCLSFCPIAFNHRNSRIIRPHFAFHNHNTHHTTTSHDCTRAQQSVGSRSNPSGFFLVAV